MAGEEGKAFYALAKGLDEAGERGWTVVSMRNDWRQVFAVE